MGDSLSYLIVSCFDKYIFLSLKKYANNNLSDNFEILKLISSV